MDNPSAPCILIVDDDSDLRRTFAAVFGNEYRVLEASGGKEALDLIKKQAPRLMVLDFSMPGMNGLDVLKAAKEAAPSLPVIMVTSVQDIETARKALSTGACEFLTKPFDVGYLRSEIRRVLRTAGDDDARKGSDGRPWRVQNK
jgi:DNA-binding NtrC family response regulator